MKGGSLELLYWVDRTLTRLLQNFSRFLFFRLKIPLVIQPLLILFLVIPIQMLVNRFFEIGTEDPTPVYYVLIYLVLVLLSGSMGIILGIFLEILHAKIDPERYFDRDKDYTCGHMAWGHMTLSGLCFMTVFFTRTQGFSDYTFTLGCFAMAPNAFREFIYRRRFNRPKSKQGLTEAMRKLLERCKSWLPKPAPVPS